MSDHAMFLASIAGSTDADQTRHFRENVQRMGVIPVADAAFRLIVRSSFPTRHREPLNRIGTIQTPRRPEHPRPSQKSDVTHKRDTRVSDIKPLQPLQPTQFRQR